MATSTDPALKPGHCSNCHSEFDPESGNQLCPPCSRAYVMGLAAAGRGDLHTSYRNGWNRGWESGFEQGAATHDERLRRFFLFREDLGFESLAEVVQALWPEP